jgi:hypothetical protein
MTKIHPHHDVIVAYLEGKTVQCKLSNADGEEIWCDVAACDKNGGTMPAFHTRSVYRIKPIVKPNVTKGFMVHLADIGTSRQEVVFARPGHWQWPNLELTFDGNTNELVSAKVL